MENPIISDELADSVLDRLAAETIFPRVLFQYEIQDDFRSLFISIAVDELPDAELQPALQRIARLLRDLFPNRDNDYAWVVGLKRDGRIIESCFGGNSAIPDWDSARFVTGSST